MAFIINKLDKICERNSLENFVKGSAKFNRNFKFKSYEIVTKILNFQKKKPLKLNLIN